MIPEMIIVVDECRDLIFQIGGKEVTLQQEPALEPLMSTFDLALCLRMARATCISLIDYSFRQFPKS